MKVDAFKNPFKPGAGHMPPYLAGRQDEEREFRRLLAQDTILENLVLTGLRGVGKTVLLEKFKPIAVQMGWLWVGTDLSETTSISEANLIIRIVTDLSVVTSSLTLQVGFSQAPGFLSSAESVNQRVDFAYLSALHDRTPGLPSDKLKAVLEFVNQLVAASTFKGIIFAYDEAQNLADYGAKDQYPLSMMLDVFQSIQRRGVNFMLALVGLPTLFPKLVEARTFAERMFRVVALGQLKPVDSKEAIVRPVADAKCIVKFSDESVTTIVELSGGYPYFIQFICKEIFDLWIQMAAKAGELAPIPRDEITRKLDTDFFAGRWAKATDRQRELLYIISCLPNRDAEFTVLEIVEASGFDVKPFSASHVNQMLVTLANAGLIYKNRHGKYSFAVPLMADFVRRQYADNLRYDFG